MFTNVLNYSKSKTIFQTILFTEIKMGRQFVKSDGNLKQTRKLLTNIQNLFRVKSFKKEKKVHRRHTVTDDTKLRAITEVEQRKSD